MVYPQIKAMIYSDSNFGSTSHTYLLGSSPAVNKAYTKATNQNPVLLNSLSDDASYYTKASTLSSSEWEGTMILAAYTYAPTKQSAIWYVDDKVVGKASEYPYNFQLNVHDLTPGKHTVEVKFSKGASKKVTFDLDAPDL